MIAIEFLNTQLELNKDFVNKLPDFKEHYLNF